MSEAKLSPNVLCLDLIKVPIKKNMGIESVPSYGYINQVSLREHRFPTLDSKFKIKYQPYAPQILTT